jgi:NitT/TauT family transport system substrate-binding protein
MTITTDVLLPAFQTYVTSAQQVGFLRGTPDLARLIELIE